MKKIINCYILLFSMVVFAQDRMPIMKSDGETPIALHNIEVEVETFGQTAITTIVMQFHNPNNRVLEGNLSFPLSEGQRVIGYGLDVNGKLRDGVVVEKSKGRQIFEEIERRGIDPGLIEKTEGNNYRTRIYPFNPEQSRTVKIVLQENLKTSEESKNLMYQFPVLSHQKLEHFKLKITAFTSEKPIITKLSGVEDMAFLPWQNAFVAEINREKFQQKETIGIEIPVNTKPMVYTEIVGDEVYFFAPIFGNEMHSRTRKIPNLIHLFWDTSFSSKAAKKEQMLVLLGLLYANNSKQKIQLFSFDLYQTNHGVFNNYTSLESAIKQLEYDGASRIKNINFNDLKSGEIWLFTDGLNNLTDGELTKTKIPLYTFSQHPKNNFQFLKNFAVANGGLYMPLNIDAKKTYEQLMQQPNFLEDLKTAMKKENIFLSKNYLDPSGIWVYGKYALTSKPQLSLKFEGAAPIDIDFNQQQNLSYAAKFWAQEQINWWMMDEQIHQQDITDLAKQHALVTNYTSLIVLEDIMDYVDNELLPPEELRAEYYALLNEKETMQKEGSNDILEQVWKKYEERISWWEKEYKPRTKKEISSDSNRHDTNIEEAAAEVTENVLMETDARAVESERYAEGAAEESADGVVDHEAGMVIEEQVLQVSDDSVAQDLEPSKKKANVELTQNELPDYLSALKIEDSFAVYDSLRMASSDMAIFYLDAAEFYYQKGKKKIAFRILSNLVEIHLEDPILMRILAHKFQQWKQYDWAKILFEKVKYLRPEEPQSHRDLALLLFEKGEKQKGAELLWAAISTPWERFQPINELMLFEMNNLIHPVENQIDLSFIEDKKYYHPLPVDIRVVLTWSVPETDLDLWVEDPFKERCGYSHTSTQIGGRYNADFTQGYGPEEFTLKKGKDGDYAIQVKFFANRFQQVYGATVLQADIFTNFGTKKAEKKSITLYVKDEKEMIDIGRFNF